MLRKIYKVIKRVPGGFWIVTLTYLVLVLLMLPFRQLSYQDDFAFYLTVKNFLSTGVLKISEWSAPSLIFQTYWGAFFASIFGMSFKALHLSNVVLFYFGLVAFYLTLKELGRSEGVSTIMALSLMAYPNIFRSLYSFMTDMFYLSLILIAMLFVIKLIKTDKLIFAFLAAVFSGLAFLNRQLGTTIMIAEVIAIVAKSIYARKVYLKQFIVLIVTFMFFIIPYQLWLGVDNNMTLGQKLYIHDNFTRLSRNFLPHGFIRFRVTNDIYDEFVVRVGRYLSMIFGLSSFALLFFLPGLSRFRVSKKNITTFLLGACVLFFFYYCLFGRVKNPNFLSLIIFDSPGIIGDFYSRWGITWKKFFNVLVFTTFIPWAYIVGTWINKFINIFFIRKERTNHFLLISSLILFSTFPIWTMIAGYADQGKELFKYMFMVYLFWGVGLILISFFSFYRIKNKIRNLPDGISVLFIVLFASFQMGMTVLGIFAWDEYIIPFIPLLLIGLSFLVKESSFYFGLMLLILCPFLFFSVSNAKGDYEINGIKWELTENKVDEGLIKPTEASIVNWPWIPYFYYEESFANRVNEFGGNKYLIGQMHTWWDTPKYSYVKARLDFVPGGCPDQGFSDGAVSLGQTSTKSIFFKRTYCVKYFDRVN